MGASFSKSNSQATGSPQDLSLADITADSKFAVNLLESLRLATERPSLPVRSHCSRLKSGARGVSRDFVRGARVFFGSYGSLGKVMGDVCKEAGLDTSVCALTRSTGLSLAESIVLCAECRGESAATLVGTAETFFSYSWTGTKLGDMLGAVDRELERLEAADGHKRYVWVDMFCASQNLLAGCFFASDAEKAELKAAAPAGAHPSYLARKEDTDNIFGDALASVKELLLYMSPLTEEWAAPPHSYLFAERGEPPASWTRRGPGAITRAWCLFEMGKCLQKRCDLHVVLNKTDAAGLERLLTHRFGEVAGIVAGVDARDAQISKTEDRDYIRKEIDALPGGAGAINAAVCASLQRWLAEEGHTALRNVPEKEKCMSPLIDGLATLLHHKGDLKGAEVLHREALDGRREKLGHRHEDTLRSMNSLGWLLMDTGDLDGAGALLREAVDAYRETHGSRHRRTLKSIDNLGSLMQCKGDLKGAEALYREALDGRRSSLSDRHAHTITSINNLGLVLREKGDLNGAEALYREAVDAYRETLGDRHHHTLIAIDNLGLLFQDKGDLDSAEALLCEALKGRRETLGSRHPDTLLSFAHFGSVLQDKGDLDGAEALYREAVGTSRETLGGEHRRTLSVIGCYADLLRERGKANDALALIGDAPSVARQTLGADNVRTLVLDAKKARIRMACGEADALRPVVKHMEAVLGVSHPETRKYTQCLIQSDMHTL